jgi:hypothetical protein
VTRKATSVTELFGVPTASDVDQDPMTSLTRVLLGQSLAVALTPLTPQLADSIARD